MSIIGEIDVPGVSRVYIGAEKMDEEVLAAGVTVSARSV